MADSGGDDREWVVMASGSPWRVAAHRQQALARQLAADFRVLFVDPPGNRPRRGQVVRKVGDSLWHAVPPVPLPLNRHLPTLNWIGRRSSAQWLRRWLDLRPGRRTLWIDEDLAVPLAGALGESRVIYDATDLDWTFTRRWNRWHLRRALRRAVGTADLVLASSSALPARLPTSRRPPVVLANGCDPQHFSPQGPVAGWVSALPRPRLGYVGAIDTRAFDSALVAALARAHPEWAFVLVGPATAAGRKPLAGLPNVHIAGPVPYLETPTVIRGCDVGLIPYRVGGLIDYVHPKKTYEYLAAGKPVVGTPLPALTALTAPVRLAAGAGPFAAAVAAAIRCADCPVAGYVRRASALANTWQVRGERLRGLLASAGSGR